MTSSLRRALVVGTIAIVSLAFCPASLLAQFSDFDGDNDVDNFDLMIVLENNGVIDGGNPFIGDADQDGDVDGTDYQIAKTEFDSSLAFTNSVGIGPPDPNAAKLLYNPANGALLLDQANAPGGILTAFILQSGAAFNANPTSFPFSNPFLSNLATRNASIIAQADDRAVNIGINTPTGLPANPFNLGNVLPPGLNLAGLQVLGLRGEYLGEIVNQPLPRLRNFQLQVIPEPSGAFLAIVVMAMFGVRRRGGRSDLHGLCSKSL